MQTQQISQLFEANPPLGQNVQVQGWVRTKRDSKAGFSFVAVHDGSSFDPIQAVIPATLTNYTSDVLAVSYTHLTLPTTPYV